MSDNLVHEGRCLGYVHSYTGDDSTKFILEMEGIDGLERLCKLPDEALLELGESSMTYREFRERILSITKRIYLSTHEYNLDMHPRSSAG